MEEIWKDIIGFENLYQVSNLGRVKSLNRFRIGKSNKPVKVNERILKQRINNWGYLQVILCKENKLYCKYIHRLVCETFHPNPHELPQVNHINGIKTDNYVDNLEWCTLKENVQHSNKTGLRNPEKKLTKIQIQEIINLKDKLSYRKIGELYGVHNTAISYIFNRKKL